MLMSYVSMLEKIDIIWTHYQKSPDTKLSRKRNSTGKEIKFSDVEISLAKDYASEDADITYRLYRYF